MSLDTSYQYIQTGCKRNYEYGCFYKMSQITSTNNELLLQRKITNRKIKWIEYKPRQLFKIKHLQLIENFKRSPMIDEESGLYRNIISITNDIIKTN